MQQQEISELEIAVDQLFAPSEVPTYNDWDQCYTRYGVLPVLRFLAGTHPDLSTSALNFFYRKLQSPEYNPSRPIKTIAMLYRNMRLGGTERIMVLQMKMFTEMGLKVVLITDIPPDDNEYSVPPSVQRIMIPEEKDRLNRITALAEVLKKESVDLLYLHGVQTSFFDILTCRFGVGIPCICHFHFNFSFKLSQNNHSIFSKHLPIYKLCNLVICLSRVNAAFFQLGGCNAVYLPNPLTFSIAETVKHPETRIPRTILWMGRISAQKNPVSAAQIIKLVSDEIPEAKLIMVGAAVVKGDKPVEKQLQQFISKNNLENQVFLAGATNTPQFYYQQADLFLSTSATEGFPCTFGEALCHGLPVVAFDLPCVEYLREPENGIRVVEQNDIHGAAKSIVDIFSRPDYYRQLSNQALKIAEKYSDYDFPSTWRNIFASLEKSEKFRDNDPDLQSIRLMLEQLLKDSMFRMNSLDSLRKKLQKDIGLLKKERDKLKKERDSLKKSLSYRLGRALTWFPRKLRGGVRCLKEHGVSYTFRRLLQKLRIIPMR